MWSTFIMDLLLLLMAYGNPVTPSDDAWQWDFNGNGVIDNHDLLTMLSQQPPLCTQPKSWPTPSR